LAAARAGRVGLRSAGWAAVGWGSEEEVHISPRRPLCHIRSRDAACCVHAWRMEAA